MPAMCPPANDQELGLQPRGSTTTLKMRKRTRIKWGRGVEEREDWRQNVARGKCESSPPNWGCVGCKASTTQGQTMSTQFAHFNALLMQ
mmetsp:Transcript_7619/g.12093  ORF Transcript_7619/g.12093 Transcript_7619/m.12093 type:complete len:89 (-) Transcript_7619:47-313(-)